MVSIKGISENHCDSIKIHICHMYAFLSTEWDPFSCDMLLAMPSLLI